jgi:hypothetical protein
MIRPNSCGRTLSPRLSVAPLLALVLALSGCFSEWSDQPRQDAAALPDATGTLTDGGSPGVQYVVGKGVAGVPRLARVNDSGNFTLSLTDLDGPYLLSNTLSPQADPGKVLLTSIATAPGVINLSPLTTLLTAQVLGTSPANAVTSFNSGGVSPELITEAAIQAAQVEVSNFLQDIYGLEIGAASFTSTSFTARAGDPMFDAILALNARLQQDHRTLRNLAAAVGNGARACQGGALQVLSNAGQRKFCAVLKSAMPDDADATILEYLFRNVAGEELTLRARNATLLSVQFARLDGRIYSCAAPTCSGITLDAPEADESRFIDFASTTLSVAGATVVLTGRLRSAIPGLILPPLACTANRYYVVFPDRNVSGDCIELNYDPFNLGGNFNYDAGPGRMKWSLSNNGAEGLPSHPAIELMLDVSGAQPAVASIYFTDQDPDNGEARNRYLCQGATCSGVTFGPVTVDTTTAPGYQISKRNIEFANTPLLGLTADGGETGESAQLTGTFTLLSTPNTSAWPTADPCDAATSDPVAGEVGGIHFNLCVGQNRVDFGIYYRYVYDNQDGTLQAFASNEAGDQQVVVYFDQGAVTEADAYLGPVQFQCVAAACAGITLSAPDATGSRRLSLAGTAMSRKESYPQAGELTLRLDVSNLLLPPYQ